MTDGAFLVRDRFDGEIYAVFSSFDKAIAWVKSRDANAYKYWIDGRSFNDDE